MIGKLRFKGRSAIEVSGKYRLGDNHSLCREYVARGRVDPERSLMCQ